MITLATIYVIKSSVVGLLCWALWTDTRSFIIPNRISLGIVGLYPAWVLATWPQVDALGGVITCAVLLFAGFALFSTGVLGGGDAKLMAAVGLWVGPSLALQFVLLTAVLGGGLALTIFVYACRREQVWRNASWASVRAIGAEPVPYGIAIALGAVATILAMPI